MYKALAWLKTNQPILKNGQKIWIDITTKKIKEWQISHYQHFEKKQVDSWLKSWAYTFYEMKSPSPKYLWKRYANMPTQTPGCEYS